MKAEEYRKLLKDLCRVADPDEERLRPLFLDGGDEQAALRKACRKVFRAEIRSIRSLLRKGKSVIVSCRRRLAASIGEALRDEGDIDFVFFGSMDFGQADASSVAKLRAELLRTPPRADEAFVVYNADVLGSPGAPDSGRMDEDFFLGVLEKMRLGGRFVLFADPDYATFLKAFEKEFETLAIGGIPDPLSVLPLLREAEAQRVLRLEEGFGWAQAGAEAVAVDEEAISRIVRLHTYLSGFDPELARRIMDSRLGPDEGAGDFVEQVKARRNAYVREETNTGVLLEGGKGGDGCSWLAKEQKRICDLLDYSERNSATNPHKRIKGIILYGPPGNSKTTLIKSICRQRRMNHLIAGAQDIKNRYVGDSEKAVSELFRRAERAAPCFLVFDEMDALFTSRDSIESGSSGMLGIVNTLLREMDSLETSEGVFVFGTTNRLELVDRAFLRPGRFDVLVKIDDPSAESSSLIVDYFVDYFYPGDGRFGSPGQRRKIKDYVAGLIEGGERLSVADISYLVKMLELESGAEESLSSALGAIREEAARGRADTRRKEERLL